MAAPFDLDDENVVVIIGTGAGGGVLGHELALKGIPVVALEAGGDYQPEDFINDEWESFAQLAWLDMRTTSGSWRIAKDFPNLPSWIVKAVGGTTTHFAGASIRFQEHEWKALSTYGPVQGANLLDWPIDGAEMAPWYDKAEAKMGVTRTGGRPGLPGNNNYKVFEAGAKKLGYQSVDTGTMAINAVDYDDRVACRQTGFCFQGCKWGAKWSTAYTDVPRAMDTGNYELRTGAMALRIEHDDSGRVTGVVYVDADGKQQRQKAKLVAVAGNTIESPRLLLNSARRCSRTGSPTPRGRWGATTCGTPRGRSMRSSRSRSGCGAARRWPASSATRRGTTRAAGSSAATSSRRCRSGCRSWRPSSTRAPGGGSSPRAMDGYDKMAGMWIVGEDMPQETNRVTLNHDVKDAHGQPVPNVHYDDHPNDVAMRSHAYAQGEAIYRAVGAVRALPTPPYPSTHNLGTNRMSENPRDGVVNRWGQSHDIPNLFVSDGSQFTSGAAENPTLTIVALAIRQADHIGSELSKGNI